MGVLVYFGHMDARTYVFRKVHTGPCGRTGLETPT